MSSNRKNHKSAAPCHSAGSARSIARNGNRAPHVHENDAESFASSSASCVVSQNQYNPFITQNLAKIRKTKSGKLSLNYCVGSRLSTIQQYEDRMYADSGCAFYFNPEADTSKNSITIIADNEETMVAGINTLTNINNRLKTHGVTMETREIPISNISNVLPLLSAASSLTTYETPLVSCHFGRDVVRITAPVTDIDAAVSTMSASIMTLMPKPKTSTKTVSAKPLISLSAVSGPSLKSVGSVESVESKQSLSAFNKAYIERMEAVFDAEADSFDLTTGTIVSDEVETTPSLYEMNRSVKPPSKAETARLKASGGGGSLRTKFADYVAEEGQIYSVVTKLDGGNKVAVKIISKDDDMFGSECKARISGSMSRRGNKAGKGKKLKSHNYIAVGQVVIASKRDFETDTKWLDIIKKVPDDVVSDLVRTNLIPKNYYQNPYGDYNGDGEDDESDCGFFFGEANDDASCEDEFDFDTL